MTRQLQFILFMLVNELVVYTFSALISKFLAVMEPMSAPPMEFMLANTYFVAVKFLDIIIIENSSIYFHNNEFKSCKVWLSIIMSYN